MSSEIKDPGWHAIDNALEPIYHGQEHKHYGTLISYELGGSDPIRGISAYKRMDPMPHWHFVTYGFSELYEKLSQNKEVSGWGFELTFRLKTEADSQDPPMWALNFLQNIARYVFGTGNAFIVGDYMNANGPIATGVHTQIRSILFAEDPELAPIDTSNGCLAFLQVVGMTNDEELAVKQWVPVKAISVFRKHLPLLITDLNRQSLLSNAEVKNCFAEGAAEDGSSTASILVDQLSWHEDGQFQGKPVINVTLGARQLRELLALLPYRLPYKQTFGLVGQECQIILNPSANNGYRIDGQTLQVELRPGTVKEICDRLADKEGAHDLLSFPNLRFQVKKTFIKDDDGNIVDTIG